MAAWGRAPAATETPLIEAFYPIPEAICPKGILSPCQPAACMEEEMSENDVRVSDMMTKEVRLPP